MKPGRILIIMIASQLLLTLFVLQWLRSQYSKQREMLHADLVHLYIESQDEIIDSLLMSHVVDPVLHDSSLTAFKTMHFSGKSVDSVVVDMTARSLPVNSRGAVIRVNLHNDSTAVPGGNHWLEQPEGENEFLLRSVKLIADRTRDSSGKGKAFYFSGAGGGLDTSGFKKLYREKIDSSMLDVEVSWVSANMMDDSISQQHNGTLVITAGSKGLYPEASVKHYVAYILGRMLPQLLFGFILLVLTGLAFYMAYRSLQIQLQLNIIRNEFISNITHELKTPVSTMRLIIDSLRKEEVRSDKKILSEYLGMAADETGRLEKLIGRVLDHSLMEEGQEPLELAVCDMKDVVEDVVDKMSARINGGKAIVKADIRAGKTEVMCDRLYLEAAVTNLVDNSLKYSGESPEVEVILSGEGGEVIIEVKDNGPGIPEIYLKKVFDKFFRVPSGNIHDTKGYGLGLSFTALVMRLHNGNVKAVNRKDGCSFILTLPLALHE